MQYTVWIEDATGGRKVIATETDPQLVANAVSALAMLVDVDGVSVGFTVSVAPPPPQPPPGTVPPAAASAAKKP